MATVRIQVRRGTAAQWTSANPILAAGEIGQESDTNLFKFGNGTSTWTALAYANNSDVSIGEISQDAINTALSMGSGLTKSYNDGANTITISVDTDIVATKSYVDTEITATEEYADNAASDAQAAAISAAASDATTKANNAKSGAETTAANALSSHESDTTNIHGIADTSALATKTYADDAVSTHNSDTTNVHGIANTADLATQNYVDTAVGGLQNTVESDYMLFSERGAMNGVAPLDSNTKVQGSYLYINGGTGIDYDSSTGTIDIDNTVTTLTGTQTLTNKTLTSPSISSPTLTGVPTAPTATAGTNTTQIATTEFVETAVSNLIDGAPGALNTLNELAASLGDDSNLAGTITNELALKAPLTNPVFLTSVTLPAATTIGNVLNTEIAHLEGVTGLIQDQIDSKAPHTSPTFTGTVTLPTTTAIGNISATEIGYLDGATSNLQDQIDAKSPSADPEFTGTVTLPTTTSIGNVSATEIGYLDGLTSSIQTQLDSKLSTTTASNTYQAKVSGVSDTEIAYLDGVTSAIQTQLDSKASSSSVSSTYATKEDATFTGTITLPSTTSIGDVSSTEISYVNGVTSAIQTQIDAKAPLANPTFTGTVSGITKSMVGLGNVDNTSDADKLVSTATQAALDLKAPLASPTFTGTVTLPDNTITNAMMSDNSVDTAEIKNLAVTTGKINDAAVTNAKLAGSIDWTKLSVSSTVSSTELGYVDGVTSSIQTQIDSKAPLDSPTFTGTVTIPAGASISGFAPLASPTFTGTVAGITKSMVDLANVDNTSDANKPVSTATQTALDAKLALAGGTMTGDLTLAGAPTADLHAATKAYVDNVVSGINFHQPVRVATTANITLSGTQTIDGVSLSVGDRVLVKDQSNQKNNGIYEVKNGAWSRTADADNTPSGELAGGDFCLVLEGTVNSGYGYVCSNTSAITIGTTDITYAAFNAAKAVTAGSGLTESTPGTLDIATGGVTSAMIADGTIVDGDISASAAIAQSKISGLSSSFAAKADLAGPTFTGTVTLPSTTSIGNVSATEIGYVDGVTSAIQTQLDAKAPLASPTFTGTVTVSASGVAFTDGTQTKEGVPSRTYIYGTTNSNALTANTTLNSLAYRDTMIEINHTSGTAVTITVPKDSTTNFPIGTSIDLLRTNTGAVTIAPEDVTVTVNATPGFKLRAQWSSATLFKRAANTWVLLGDLTA